MNNENSIKSRDQLFGSMLRLADPQIYTQNCTYFLCLKRAEFLLPSRWSRASFAITNSWSKISFFFAVQRAFLISFLRWTPI